MVEGDDQNWLNGPEVNVDSPPKPKNIKNIRSRVIDTKIHKVDNENNSKNQDGADHSNINVDDRIIVLLVVELLLWLSLNIVDHDIDVVRQLSLFPICLKFLDGTGD